MDVLARIMAERRAAVQTAQAAVPVEELHLAVKGRKHRSLVERLQSGRGTAVIAEVKKASPSAGLLRPMYDPAHMARGYARSGAAGISVLTEPQHFLGKPEDLQSVRAVVDVPVLRKDFLCDPYQVVEAAAWGADVVLLIAAALSKPEMILLYREACSLGLEVLAEIHNESELQDVLSLDEAIIGVNSRNLKTLKTDLNTARRLVAEIPPGRLAIAESGISSRAEVEELEALGYKGFLVGESLLRQEDPGAALAALLGG